jgi:hypothetical protein
MSNLWGMSEEAQEIVRQDLNNAPREQAVLVPMAEEPPLPLIQPTPQELLFQQRVSVRENAGDERPAQRPRTIPPFGQPGSGPRFPSEPISTNGHEDTNPPNTFSREFVGSLAR